MSLADKGDYCRLLLVIELEIVSFLLESVISFYESPLKETSLFSLAAFKILAYSV